MEDTLILERLERATEKMNTKIDNITDKLNRMEVERAKSEMLLTTLATVSDKHEKEINELHDIVNRRVQADLEREKQREKTEKRNTQSLNNKLVVAGVIVTFVQILLDYLL